jgi:hypothetical protein
VSGRCEFHAHSAARLAGDEQARVWARELIEAEERWPYRPDGCVIVNAEIARWALLLDQELRIREESQIPVIPRGAQNRIEFLEARLEEFRYDLGEALGRAERAEESRDRAYHLFDALRDALGEDRA